MEIKISKNEKEYSLTLNSGHFSGTLSNISESKLKELVGRISELIENKNDDNNCVLTWNPRSHRWEHAK